MLGGAGAGQTMSYEMNVHRGESLAQLDASVQRWVIPIRERVTAGQPFALAPRIGRGLLRELRDPQALADLRQRWQSEKLFPITINAFPLEDFHAARVKEQVYSPPWTDRERGDLTAEIAGVLAYLLPENTVGTVSTLGGTYRKWGHDTETFRAIGRNYLRTIRRFVELERSSGRTVLLTVEPEPDTTFETAIDVIELFEESMLPQLGAELAEPLGLSHAAAEEALRRFYNVNLDVCHQSVLFRDPVAEWQRLEQAGLRVGKLHLTSALSLPKPASNSVGLNELQAYHEPRYLHQFAGLRDDGSLLRGSDLDELEHTDVSAIRELRCHFHVPLSRATMGHLETTQAETAAALRHALAHPDPPQLVIETYTWPLLAQDDSDDVLIDGIAQEFWWALAECRAAEESGS